MTSLPCQNAAVGFESRGRSKQRLRTANSIKSQKLVGKLTNEPGTDSASPPHVKLSMISVNLQAFLTTLE